MLGTSKSISGFDPRTIPGCQLWLDGADINGNGTAFSVGGTISTWVDKSPLGNNMTGTSVTYTYDSTFRANGPTFNGSSSVFDQANSGLYSLNNATTWTIFTVNRRTDTSGYNAVYNAKSPGSGQNNYLIYRYAPSTGLQFYLGDTTGSYIGSGSGTGDGITTLTAQTSGTAEGFINGSSIGTGSTSSSSGQATFRIGLQTGAYMNGFIFEVLVYNIGLTTSQRQQVEGYLAHKWGLVPYYDSSTPLTIPGCQLWLDAADSSTVTGTTSVTSWADKSGNGRNTTTTGTVSYANSGISITSSSSYLTGSFGSTDYTGSTVSCFLIASMSSSSGTVGRFLSLGKVGTQDWDNLASITLGRGGGLVVRPYRTVPTSNPPSIPAYDTRFLATWGQTSSLLFNSINGGALSTASLTGAFAINAYRIGNDLLPDDVNEQLNGVINEIIVYFSELTTSQRETIERYLMKKWGIGSTPTLPSTHPFSSVRPHLRAFHPTDIDGCQLWLDGADQSSITLSGSSVTQWRDKSGNGLNVSAASSQPTYVANGLNKLGTLAFNGSQNLTAGSVTAGQLLGSTGSSATFCVFSVSDNTAGNCPISWDDSSYTWRFIPFWEPSGIIVDLGNASAGVSNRRITIPNSTLTFVNNTYYLVSFWQSGGAALLNVNGGAYTATIASGFTGNIPTSTSRTFNVGSYVNTSVYNMKGNIAEILVYNSHIPNNFKQVEGYLAHKWGLIGPSSTSPLLFPGCQLWLDAADSSSLVLSGSSVTTWNDKSGNGYHMNTLTQTAGWTGTAVYPTIGTSINGLQTVNFVAQSGLKQATTLDGVKNLFWVGRIAAAVGSSAGGFANFFLLGHDSYYDWHPPIGEKFILSGVAQSGIADASPASLFTNDPNAVTNTAFKNINLPSPPNVSLLSVAGITGTSRYQGICYDRQTHTGWCGDLAEVLIYSTALTTAQRQTIENYLLNKWGISNTSSSLISTHPFSRFPPATSAHFSPTSISGCQLWLDAADSSVVTIATGVSQWNDKSGNSNNLTQSTTGSQPTYASSLITFANNKYLNIPATVLNNLPTWSLFFVINPISTSNWIMSRQRDGVDSYNILSMTLSSTNYGGVQSGSAGFLYWRSMNAGTQLGSTDSLATSTLQTCTLTYDGTILYFYKNGELNQATTGSFALQNQTSPNTYTLGALIYPSGIDNSGVTNFKLGEMISYNTFLTNAQREKVEGYLAHKWGLLSSLSSLSPYRTLPPIFPPIIQYNITATGGTIVSTVGTTYHVFRTSSSFVVRRSVTVNYLVVGGGGGGGDRHGGGGGAGGVLSGNWSASAGTYIITVGAGGQYGSTSEGGQVAYGYPNGCGSKGGDSALSGTGISVTAYGGGGGGSYDGNPSGTVGSGGGGGGQNLSGIAGTSGQGNAGGSGLLPGAGGGGGAGGAGVAANTGTGGIGTSSFSTHLLAVGYGTTFAVPTSPNTVISGGVAYIAGGGGGCAGTSPGPGGSGGLGGGGRGDWADTNITAGTPNTGGGGGGTRSDLDALYTTGRNGGSGLVLVWY